ncbi:ATP synthase F0 subunit A [Suicoccus acidiformans]|uniref:ATP synthase subunit a n=1 Tax=Suicoccus acidiformans TaxID=2036206 RepID=A0A347WJF4_9LACT|nr:F0F1 ATP synthase subunit A [Suicoccus acidiformans]AXY25211.1 ATP synthase F0 subunit A [Suicoccus acidiformans]
MDETRIIELLGISFPLNTMIAFGAVLVIVAFICLCLNRNLSVENPTKGQILMESLVSFIKGIVRDNIGEQADKFYVIIAFGLFLFLLVANYIGLILLVDVHEVSYFKSPTADPVVAIVLAVIMNLLSHYFGAKAHGGLGKYIKAEYLSPNILSLPITVVEEVINIFTLALRLFGNIFAGEVLLKLIAQVGNSYGVLTWLAGIPLQMIWQIFSLFIGAIQAYIFVTLSSVYLSNKVSHK